MSRAEGGCPRTKREKVFRMQNYEIKTYVGLEADALCLTSAAATFVQTPPSLTPSLISTLGTRKGDGRNILNKTELAT